MSRRITLTAIGLGVVCLLALLAGIWRPSLYVFDEYYYVSGARSLLQGTHDMNPEHPPLAKYFMAAGIWLAGDNPVGWRIAGAVFGSLTVVAVFVWVWILIHDVSLALMAAALTFFDNFLFVMARVAMLDVFYFAFALWGVVAFTAGIVVDIDVARRRWMMLAAGTLFGLGIACKWTAAVSLAGAALVALILFLRKNSAIRQIGLGTLTLGLGLLPIFVYGVSYWPLCWRFHRPFTLSELASMNEFIWRYHVACPGNPTLDVRWYQWLFRATPERGLSYLMGNFVVVWLGFAAFVACAWKFLRTHAFAEGMVVLFYLVNLLQWVVIPQKRAVYYYYYPPAIFLGIALVLVLRRIGDRRLWGVRWSVLLLIAAAVFFLYCYPRMAALDAPYDCIFGCWS